MAVSANVTDCQNRKMVERRPDFTRPRAHRVEVTGHKANFGVA